MFVFVFDLVTHTNPHEMCLWTEMSVKNSGLLLVRIGFIATVALLYNFVVNAICMLCLFCNAFCFCVDPWCGISFSVCEIKLFMTFVCADLRTTKWPRRGFAKTVSARKFETLEAQVPITPKEGVKNINKQNSAEQLWNKKYLELIEQQTKQMEFCKRTWIP